MEKIVLNRPLATGGIPPLIEDLQEALKVFEVILKRGAMFYPEAVDPDGGFPKIVRIVALSES